MALKADGDPAQARILHFLRSTPAPIALEPIPASQATMILRTWLQAGHVSASRQRGEAP